MDTIHDLESAFRRCIARSAPVLPSAVQAARNALRRKGWTLRTAAPHLGVHWTHLHHVLKGNRQSASLLSRIESLPTRKPTTV